MNKASDSVPYEKILDFCRSGKPIAGVKGIYCMRQLFGGDFGIVDNNYFDARIIVRSDTWQGVLDLLKEKGADL